LKTFNYVGNPHSDPRIAPQNPGPDSALRKVLAAWPTA